jgi:hypothetical protein
MFHETIEGACGLPDGGVFCAVGRGTGGQARLLGRRMDGPGELLEELAGVVGGDEVCISVGAIRMFGGRFSCNCKRTEDLPIRRWP